MQDLVLPLQYRQSLCVSVIVAAASTGGNASLAVFKRRIHTVLRDMA